ncbi:MAG: hypothetical protein LUD14_09675 [Clostridiales bacterium]|nr:hypothetical protein [Clostridiales bacterium]
MNKGGDIYCNCCGKKIHTREDARMEDYFHLEKTWGYFSKRDGLTQEADICEDCLEQWMQTFRSAPDVRERTEIFEC